MKKVVYIFFVTKAIHTNKDHNDRKSAEKKMFMFVFYFYLSGVGFVRLDSGREPDLSGSESDMYTEQLGVRFVNTCQYLANLWR